MYAFVLYLFIQNVLLDKPLKVLSWVKLLIAGVLTIAIGIFSYVSVFSKEEGAISKNSRNFTGQLLLRQIILKILK